MSTVILNLSELVTVRMALNDRVRWLTDTLRLDRMDPLVCDTVAMLAKLDAIPVLPLPCENCLDPAKGVHAIDCRLNPRYDPR